MWLLRNYKITVEFACNAEDEYDSEKKIILINSKTNLKSQLNTLLHEAGHAILRADIRKYKKQFPSYNCVRASKDSKMDILREEFLAWEEGLKLAQKLKIKLDLEKYNGHMRKALWGYVYWAKNI